MSNLGEQAMEILNDLHTERLDYKSEYVPLAEAASLLTAYEETGLDPEDIRSATGIARVTHALHELYQYEKFGDINRLRELVEADRDGRCVVLPCKIGTTVYSVRHQRVASDEYRMSFHEELSIVSQKFGLHHADCIGKTVFLTREEAEAALREEEKK